MAIQIYHKFKSYCIPKEAFMSDSKDLSKKRYTQFAEGYVNSTSHAKGADLDILLEMAKPQTSWRMLDIATGGGHTALKFAPHVAHVTTTDLTPRMLEKAEEFIRSQGVSNIETKVADAENLTFEDESFDLLTCRIAAHHFPNAEKFVQESARVLKTGGMFLLQDQVLPEDTEAGLAVDAFERLRDPSHNRAFSQSEWFSMIQTAGFRIESCQIITKRHDLRDWAERQGNDEATIAQLRLMAETATETVKAWLELRSWGTEEASFANHHILIAARKRQLTLTD
jgi:ubiquinone/menaquinone biosynthesis C-methylase UbiE